MMNYKQAGDYLIPDLSLNTQQMNSLKAQAEEAILSELIYS